MSAQLENGYTKIADEILEKIAKTKLNGTQFRILMIVWRSTYGWGKKEYLISETYLSEATEINLRQIKRELKALIELGIVLEVEPPTFSKPRKISFNKNYTIKHQVTKKTPQVKKDTTPGDELDTTGGDELDTQNKHINKHINKQNYIEVFYHYQELGLIKHRDYTEDMTKAIKKAMKELKLDIEYCKKMLDRHKEKVEVTKNSKYPVKTRSLSEFFGQKKHKSVSLICSDYLDETFKISNNRPKSNNRFLDDLRKIEEEEMKNAEIDRKMLQSSNGNIV